MRITHSLAAAALAAVSAAACAEPAEPPREVTGSRAQASLGPVDADRDGVMSFFDCDDHDPGVWQYRAYSYRDADLDGYTVEESGTICSGASLPPGYAAAPGPGAADCDDADPAAFAMATGFLDLDGDRRGAGLPVPLCTGGELPAGFAPVDGDCAPIDPARWGELPYGSRDLDGDGARVIEASAVCSGAALPPGYFADAPAGQPQDCDDTRPDLAAWLTVYVDLDHDGIGAGPALLACTNGAPGPGYSAAGTDCADTNAAVWLTLPYAAVDFDGDGATTPAVGTRCTAGALAPPYYAAAVGNDCDDADAAVSIALTVYADGDLDGVGAGPALSACTDGAPPDGYASTSTDCDDADAARWTLTRYLGIDADGDGETVAATGQVCTNGTLPPPYRSTRHGDDCDDANPALTHREILYPDQDGDGVGAPPRQIVCMGAAVPASLSRGGYDDDDADPAVIELDEDDELIALDL